jgi:CHASE3 domain sensor protein
MLDHETGVRGYGLKEFLEPYWAGRDRFEDVFNTLGRRTDEPETRRQLRAMGAIAHRWQALAEDAVARVSYGGAHSLTVNGARERRR